MPSPRRHLSVDELSHRASTGLAIRKGDIKISDPIPSSYIHNGPEMDFGPEVEQFDGRREGAWPRRSGTGILHARTESGTQQMHVSRFTENTSPKASPLLDNNAEDMHPNNSAMQRSGSGFRATLKRMFSKKDKNAMLQKRSVYQEKRSQLHSHSDSRHSHLERSLLTSTNISRSHALHSHAVSPHLDTHSDFTPSQEPVSGQLGIRRNTVPSLSLLQEESRNIRFSEDQPPAQRPKTATRRPSPPQPQFKRRSRSADALADLLRSPKTNTSQRQDRAEEIAYWRSSILEHPMPQFTERPAVDSIAISEPTVRSDTSPSRPGRPSIEPVQDFDFGLNEGTESARPTTLQERVNTLEVKLFDFEYALAKLQGNNIAKPDLPQRVSGRRSTREMSSPENVLSTTGSSSSNNSPPLRRDEFPSLISPREHRRTDRASKATTVRPTHRRTTSSRSHASSPRSIHISNEQYDMLYNLIKDERTARQQLETHITTLQKEVDTLKQPVYTYVGSAGYPTPSPDSLRNQPVMPAARPTMRHHSPNVKMHQNVNETSRFSMTETESDTDAGEMSPDIYATPRENAFRFEPRVYPTVYHTNMI